MITGVGVDVQDYARMRKALRRTGEAFTRNVFTEKELEWACGNARRLTALFAAKEACFKALGTGWTDALALEVVHKESGEPFVRKKRGFEEGRELLLSLSYGVDSVIAFCVSSSS
jgi:holo-[acyl-carrier protein] synthase